MSNPILSIITINRNNAEGLRKTIESVLSQDVSDKTQVEYIIIDGASTDESVEVIKSFENNQSNKLQITKWISEPDSGIYNAMNKGIKMATGEYCLFLNSGDYLVDQNVLNNSISLSLKTSIVAGKLQVNLKNGKFGVVTPDKQISLNTFYRQSLPHQSTFIQTKLFEKYNFYDENYSLAADWKFFFDTLFLNNETYSTVDLLISNFKGDGASDKHDKIYQKQLIDYLSKHINNKILFDYEKNFSIKKTEEYELLSRIKKNRFLLSLISKLFKFRDIL